MSKVKRISNRARSPLQKKSYRRREASLEERKRVLIVCEGSKTEPRYFRALRNTLRLLATDVQVCDECDSAPESVVRFGREMYENDPDYEAIYFVFDQDKHESYNRALNQVRGFASSRKCKAKVVEAITSVPCFEVWFIMHFQAIMAPILEGVGKSPCGNVLKELRKRPGCGNYEKGHTNIFELLKDQLHNAMENAESVMIQQSGTGADQYHGNPSTRVYKLVKDLRELAAQQE